MFGEGGLQCAHSLPGMKVSRWREARAVGGLNRRNYLACFGANDLLDMGYGLRWDSPSALAMEVFECGNLQCHIFFWLGWGGYFEEGYSPDADERRKFKSFLLGSWVSWPSRFYFSLKNWAI